MASRGIQGSAPALVPAVRRTRRKPRPDDDVLDRLDAAALIKVSPPVFDALIDSGAVPGRNLGTGKRTHYRVARHALLVWLTTFALPTKDSE